MDFFSHYSMTVGGQGIVTNRTLNAYNPATRQVIAEVPDASEENLNDAVAAARAAFPAWSALSVGARAEKLVALADAIDAHAETFKALLIREQGKSQAQAAWEVGGAAIWCREIAKQRLEDEVVEDTAERRVVTRFTPLGVVGVIAPWNFPILLAIWKIAPALMAGNCIVVKPSPFTPLCTLKLGRTGRGGFVILYPLHPHQSASEKLRHNGRAWLRQRRGCRQVRRG